LLYWVLKRLAEQQQIATPYTAAAATPQMNLFGDLLSPGCHYLSERASSSPKLPLQSTSPIFD